MYLGLVFTHAFKSIIESIWLTCATSWLTCELGLFVAESFRTSLPPTKALSSAWTECDRMIYVATLAVKKDSCVFVGHHP